MATDTKERILDAAEGLFADRGFPGTSMRDITQGADANIAAVNYHFGSKEALLLAVLERRIEPVNQARLARLDELESSAGGQPVPIEDVVKALMMKKKEMNLVLHSFRKNLPPPRGSRSGVRGPARVRLGPD